MAVVTTPRSACSEEMPCPQFRCLKARLPEWHDCCWYWRCSIGQLPLAAQGPRWSHFQSLRTGRQSQNKYYHSIRLKTKFLYVLQLPRKNKIYCFCADSETLPLKTLCTKNFIAKIVLIMTAKTDKQKIAMKQNHEMLISNTIAEVGNILMQKWSIFWCQISDVSCISLKAW